MTDEAMNVAAEAVSMPDAQVSAPVESTAPDRDNSTRGAIERAFDALNKQEQTPGTVEQVNSGRERNPDGTFKATDAPGKPVDALQAPLATDAAANPLAPAGDAPSRFSPDAKAAWATVPEPVKAEVNRAIKELEGGIQRYQADFEPYKDFDRQLKTNGQTFQEVFEHYSGIEKVLAENPLKGLDTICRNMGLSLKQVAAHVMGQPVDQQTQQNDAYVSQLEQKINALEKQVGGVTTTIKTQQEGLLLKEIDAFAAKPENSRFDELSEDIVFFLNSGKTKDLAEAYRLADRLNPAPQAPATTIAAPAAQQTATSQTRKGQLSPSGAPSTASNVAARTPPASARDALDRAFAVTGL
jgi:hypothetical protein